MIPFSSLFHHHFFFFFFFIRLIDDAGTADTA